MTLTITIQMDNEAFDDGNGGATEAARILKRLAVDIRDGTDFVTLRDSNGNSVGTAEVTP